MADFDLPGKGPVQGYKTGTEGSMQAAGAPWAALGGLGREVSQLGQQASDHIVKLQRIENQRMADETQLKADEMFDQFRDTMLRNPGGYGTWVQDWQKARDSFIKENMPENLAPEQKMLIGDRLTKWSQRSASEVMQQASMMTINQAKIATGNLVERAYKTGDYDGGLEAINNAPYLTDEQKESARMQYDEKFETSQIIQAAEADPKGTMDALKEKNEDGTWKNYQNLDPSSRNRAIATAEQNYRSGTFDTIERFNNGLLDGSISKPEQIDQKFPNISATLKQRMKDQLEREVSDSERKYMGTPEYQQSVIGKVSSLMDGYSAEMNGFDEQFYAMDSMIRTLPESAAKARLNYRLDEIRKGQVKEWKDSFDEWRDKLSGVYKSGGFGLGVVRKTTEQLITEGILLDQAKLTGSGLSPEQAQKVIEAKPAERVNVFRKQYGERAGQDTNDPIVSYALEQIGSKSGEGFVDFPDVKLQEEAEKKYGAAVDEFEKWHRVNKDADHDTREKKFYSLLSPEGRKKFAESIIQPFDGPGILPPVPNGE